MKDLSGKDANSPSVAVRIATAKKKRNEKRVRKLEKRAYLQRITEAYDNDTGNGKEAGTKYQRVKRAAMDAYGGSCVDCGSTDLRVLELDHVEGDGANHRAVLVYGTARRGTIPAGGAFYARLRKLGYPSQPVLVVLCHECHKIKTSLARMEGRNG